MVNTPAIVNILERKERFAVEYLKDTTNPFKAACAVFGDDTGNALTAASRWPDDPEVQAFMAKAMDDMGDIHFLPTKAELAKLVWNMARNEMLDSDSRLKAARLYGDIRGFIDKQGTNININNSTTNNKVMVVTDHGTDAEWEAKCASQQARLIEDATAVRVN